MSAAEGRNGKEGSARGRTSGDTDARRARIDATTTAPGAIRSFWLTERAVRVDAPGYAQLASVALAVGHLLHPRKARHGASRCESQVPTTSVSDFAGRIRSPRGSRRARGVRETCATDARAGATRACDAAVAVPRASTPRGGLKTQAPRNRSRRENGAETAVRQRSPFPRRRSPCPENRRVSETSRPRLPGTSRGARALENPLERASAVD